MPIPGRKSGSFTSSLTLRNGAGGGACSGGAASTGKPAGVVEKIVEGKMSKFYEEVCLLDQPFVKEPGITIHQLIASKIGKLGENISVRRFARFKVGDVGETVAITKPQQDQKAE